MKYIIKTFLLFLAAIFILDSCTGKDCVAVSRSGGERFVYLVAGFDDAAENTDVLFTVSYDRRTNTVRVAQIPRDTYFDFGAGQKKINQFYAHKRVEGIGSGDAMEMTASAIGDLFGAQIDGYIGIKTSDLAYVVDAMGGVDIELASPMTLELDGEEPLFLQSGENHIGGADAVRFVRYRQGYAKADLGRMDAQKIFLNALFCKISKGLNLKTLVNLAMALQNRVITNVKLVDAVTLIFGAMQAQNEPKTYFATVPGEAVIGESGLSYYVLNRRSAAALAEIYMFADGEFDKYKKLCRAESEAFFNAYYDDGVTYTEYGNEDVKNIRLKQK